MSSSVIQPGSWELLRLGPTAKRGEYAVAGSGVVHGQQGEILLAIDGGDCRHLLIPVARNAVVKEDRSGAGVQVLSHRLIGSSGDQLFVDLACLKPHLNHLFEMVAEDVLREMQTGSVSPDQLCSTVIGNWRELLERAASNVLGPDALTGLFGELLQLEKISRVGRDALAAWTGPTGHRHDFARGATALECKSTTVRRGRRLQINGHLQLEPSIDGTLYLAFAKLEVAESVGTSVPQLVNRLLATGRFNRADLLRKLALVGYDPVHEIPYNQVRFAVLEELIYVVDESFPRIVRGSFVNGDLPPGVQDLVYAVDISSQPPIPLPPAERTAIYTRLAA